MCDGDINLRRVITKLITHQSRHLSQSVSFPHTERLLWPLGWAMATACDDSNPKVVVVQI